MALIQQLELFELSTEEKNMRRIEEIQKSLHKVRKGTYANISNVNRRLMHVEELLENLTRYICKGTE